MGIVFLSSDSPKVIQYLKKTITEPTYTLDKDPVHTLKTQAKDKRLYTTLATWFLISEMDAVFLTVGSLFGRSASERGNLQRHRYWIRAR